MSEVRALIVVDVQEDFCEGGRLAVAGGNEVARGIREYASLMKSRYEAIVFTKDWHNPWPDDNNGHFSKNPDFNVSWPVHCESNGSGANFHPAVYILTEELGTDYNNEIFYKGQGDNHYSGFEGKNLAGEYLAEALRYRGITAVDIVGIAGDYCVRATALDALKEGFDVAVLSNMVASVGGRDATDEVVKEVRNAGTVSS